VGRSACRNTSAERWPTPAELPPFIIEKSGLNVPSESDVTATMKSQHFTTDWRQGDRRAKLPTVFGIATET
jgi:hypothetical protein